MENYFLEKTIKTPRISADKTGIISIEGICISENVFADLGGIVSWLDAYMEIPAEETTMNVRLDYYNTSTAAVLRDMFKTLQRLKSGGKKVTVNWYYDDEDSDTEDSGYHYASMVDVEFNVIPYRK
ncbi:MAG TPA: DUF1987 domain-containing protein [Flavobacteriales bacterium]|nr:DUF1987 domain-containing protein [Flavobacteriales bacterium]